MFLTGFGYPQNQTIQNLVWPKPPEKPRIQFLYSFSSTKDLGIEKSWWQKVVEFFFGEEQDVAVLKRPQGIAVDCEGKIYITDIGSRCVHIFDIKSKKYQQVRREGSDAFVSPVGVAVTEKGILYVADADRKIIDVFDNDAKYLYSINIGLLRPTGLWISGNILYIVDTEANQILISDLQGNIQSRIGQRGEQSLQFNYPVYLCAKKDVSNVLFDRLYVVDAMNFRLQILRSDGTFLSTFGKLGQGIGQFARPKGVALDSDGHIYLADALFDVVQIFDQSGKVLLSFGGSGNGFGNFSLPAGIAIDTDDKIYIVDSGNHRIQVFQYLR